MSPEEKIYKVLRRIKEKVDISPANSIVNYRAGEEVNVLGTEDEIMILNKLADERIITVVQNFASDFI